MSSTPDNPEPATNPLSVDLTIRLYHDALMSFLRHRHRRTEDAADIAQETYLRLTHYEGSTEVRSPSALLYRIATNVIYDRVRRSRAHRAEEHVPIEGLELTDEAPSAERQIAGHQDLEQLYQVIAGLQPKCRQVFLLSRVKHMTYAEIAQHCHISVKMVEKYISQALQICVKGVGGRGSRPSNTL